MRSQAHCSRHAMPCCRCHAATASLLKISTSMELEVPVLCPNIAIMAVGRTRLPAYQGPPQRCGSFTGANTPQVLTSCLFFFTYSLQSLTHSPSSFFCILGFRLLCCALQQTKERNREKRQDTIKDGAMTPVQSSTCVCAESCPGGYQVGIEYIFFWDRRQQGGSRATFSPQQL